MKSPLVLLATICLVASGLTQAPKQGTLTADTQIPLVMDGKTVGSMTLKAGTQVNIIQVLPDGALVSRGAEPPFKLPKESLGAAPQSLQALQEAAEKGDATSQDTLGLKYKHGEGVPQDNATAIAWFKKSADQGSPKGERDLASMYFAGQGVPKDPKAAQALFAKAAAAGDKASQDIMVKYKWANAGDFASTTQIATPAPTPTATPTTVATPTPIATPPPIVAATPKPTETDNPINPAPLTGQGYVSIEKTSSGGFQLLRDGKPYHINGMCCVKDTRIAATLGVNSIRWYQGRATYVAEKLTQAQREGLTMIVPFELQKIRQAGDKREDYLLAAADEDFANPVWKAETLKKIKEVIEVAKNNPATLMYCIGNEVNNGTDTTPEMWEFINEIAVYTHQADPHHPVIGDLSYTKGCPGFYKCIKYITAYAPALDAIGFNFYEPSYKLTKVLAKENYQGPWIITEYGPPGFNHRKNKAKQFLEYNSDEQASEFEKLYKDFNAQNHCLGCYGFIWNHGGSENYGTHALSLHIPPKPKEGLHNESRASLDALQTCWTGTIPINPAPRIESITINGSTNVEDCIFKKDQEIAINFKTIDPKNNSLTYVWHLYKVEQREEAERREGFSRTEIQAITKNDDKGAISLSIPNAGFYRIYGYSLNNKGKAATMNIPIQIAD